MSREEIYKFLFDYYYGLYISMKTRIPNYNPKLSFEDNARRRANIKAVENTEVNFLNQQSKERK